MNDSDIVEYESREVICRLVDNNSRIRIEEFEDNVLVKTYFSYNREKIEAMKVALKIS